VAPGLSRAAFDPAAAVHVRPPFHEHRHRPAAPFRDSPVETGTPVGPHPPLQAMTNFAVAAFHCSICCFPFFRASIETTTDYITRSCKLLIAAQRHPDR